MKDVFIGLNEKKSPHRFVGFAQVDPINIRSEMSFYRQKFKPFEIPLQRERGLYDRHKR